jgi:hypothetical protein
LKTHYNEFRVHQSLEGTTPTETGRGSKPGDPKMPEDISRGLKAIVDLCHTKAPNATLIITAIFPRNNNMEVIPTINQINRNIERLADVKQIRYLNINDKLADSHGTLFPPYARTTPNIDVWPQIRLGRPFFKTMPKR